MFMICSMMVENASESRLFLAAVPDAAAAERIFRMASVLKRAYGFSGKLTERDRLHVSLFFLRGLPDEMVYATFAALSDVRMQPFDVVFDRSVSFRGRAGNRPFVLIGDDGPSELKSLREMLGATLTRKGLRGRANELHPAHHAVVRRAQRRGTSG